MKKVVFVGQLAPPIHGVTVMNKIAVNVLREYDLTIFNLSSSKSLSHTGKLNLFNICSAIKNLLNFFYYTFKHAKTTLYFTFCPSGWALYRDFLIVIIAKLFRMKIVLHLHGQGVKLNSKKYVNKIIYKIAFKNCKIIHLSYLLINDIEDYVCKKNISIINNCISSEDVDLIKKCINDSYSHSYNTNTLERPIKLLFLSNLMVNKGFVEYLETVKYLSESDINVVAYLVGDFKTNDDELAFNKFKEKNESLFSNEVIIKKSSAYDIEKYKFMVNCDFMIFPSMIDTFPMVLLEALSCGMYCLSTNSGAIPDILQNDKDGMVVNFANKQGILEIMVNHEKYSNSIERALRLNRALERYSILNFEKQLRVVIDKN